jgi:hypothetical protein
MISPRARSKVYWNSSIPKSNNREFHARKTKSHRINDVWLWISISPSSLKPQKKSELVKMPVRLVAR